MSFSNCGRIERNPYIVNIYAKEKKTRQTLTKPRNLPIVSKLNSGNDQKKNSLSVFNFRDRSTTVLSLASSKGKLYMIFFL